MTTIKTKTLNEEGSQVTEAISDLKVTSSTRTNVRIDLPVSYTRENFPVGDDDIDTPDKIKHLKYPQYWTKYLAQSKKIQ